MVGRGKAALFRHQQEADNPVRILHLLKTVGTCSWSIKGNQWGVGARQIVVHSIAGSSIQRGSAVAHGFAVATSLKWPVRTLIKRTLERNRAIPEVRAEPFDKRVLCIGKRTVRKSNIDKPFLVHIDVGKVCHGESAEVREICCCERCTPRAGDRRNHDAREDANDADDNK